MVKYWFTNAFVFLYEINLFTPQKLYEQPSQSDPNDACSIYMYLYHAPIVRNVSISTSSVQRCSAVAASKAASFSCYVIIACAALLYSAVTSDEAFASGAWR